MVHAYFPFPVGATLSDLSFVLAKNGREGYVELGIIAESLQKAEGCYLPAFRFNLSDRDDAIQSLQVQMTSLFSQPKHRNVARCIEQYGSAMQGEDDLEKGSNRLLKHFTSILDFHGSPFVFAIVLDNISCGDRRDQDPIKDLCEAIPYTYLHIPPSFDFRIGNTSARKEQIVFQYWPQRLVELSSFTVMVSEKFPWHDPQSHVDSYKMRVFMGFDRMRLQTGKTSTTLYIYSRESGRLIKREGDARFLLGLSNSGSMYCQGLTVLIDDIEGKLPLNPTKQDVAFGEQAHGEVHKDNLFAWVGCVVKFFYEYHLAKFDNKRTRLTAKLSEFGSDPIKTRLKELDRSHVTTFSAHFSYYAKKSIRIDRKTAEENVGADTHFTLHADAPLQSPPQRPAPISAPIPPVPVPASSSLPMGSSATNGTEPVTKKMKTNNTPKKQAATGHQTNCVATNVRAAEFRCERRQRVQNCQQPVVHHGVQENQPSSQVSSATGGTVGQHSSPTLGKDSTSDTCAGSNSQKIPTNRVDDTVKQEVDATSGEVIVLVDNDDEKSVAESVAESVVSTKDEYKDLCQQLSLKLEQRKVADRQIKKENRRLKQEIAELNKELERQKLLPNRVEHQ